MMEIVLKGPVWSPLILVPFFKDQGLDWSQIPLELKNLRQN